MEDPQKQKPMQGKQCMSTLSKTKAPNTQHPQSSSESQSQGQLTGLLPWG